MVKIRKAVPEDAPVLVRYALWAMEDIVYQFLQSNDPEKALEFLMYFVQREDNQYSFQNWWIMEVDDAVVAAVNIYEGAQLETLRKPIVAYVQMHFNPHFNPEAETTAGEYYIDTLSVRPDHQGKGAGTQLLHFLMAEYVTKRHKTLGLLVEEGNPAAKKLYIKLGFKAVGTKTLVGKKMEHLQISPRS